MVDLSREEEAPRSSRFSVVARLGEGGMGTVYEAVDNERGMRVALKTLRRMDAQDVLRFKAEFRKLQDLHHPNLVSLGELVEEQGQWFFTMELVRGRDFLGYVRYGPVREAVESTQSLSPQPSSPSSSSVEPPPAPRPQPRDVRAKTVTLERPPRDVPTNDEEPDTQPPEPTPPEQEKPFEAQRLRHCLGQLALGLHALHRAGKVHRDIKPSNILVTAQGRVVLLDFGILSDVENDETWDPSIIVGTAAYMAPEQTRGSPPSPQADWYSVGVLLFHALTGEKPFRGPAQHVIQLKRQVEPPPPQELVPGLPEDLCQLCTELLRMDPTRRPSGEEVLRRLGVDQAAREEAWSSAALPFIGRQTELRALHLALSDSRRGPSVVVRVEGESGVGKSRLVRRFLEEVAQGRPDAVVLSGRCYERESVPYKGVDGIIESLARHLRGREESLLQSLRPPEMAPLLVLFPILQGLKGLSETVPRIPGDPFQLRLAAFTALRELFVRLSARHPVVMMVDDLQWADRDSAALLDELLKGRGLLMVGTVRRATDFGPVLEVANSRFWQQARVLPVEGLAPAETHALIRRLVEGSEQLDTQEVRRIAQESGGHPLFIEALVRHKRGEGQVQPLRLEDALWARAERLEPQARNLLALLAVADGPLPHAVAAHAMALQTADYSRLTASLRGARLAVTTGPASTDTVEVVHDKVRQAVAPHLPTTERQGWHARLAAALEQIGPQRPETLARHWREAGYPERAARYYLQAAHESSLALAFSRAASLYKQALEVAPWSEAERRRLYVAMGEALIHAGRGTEAAHALQAAATGAAPVQAHTLQRRAAEQYLYSGHMDEGLATMRAVLSALGLHSRMPSTQSEALRSLLWQRLKVRLRPLRWQTREAHQLPPGMLERLEVLSSMSSTLAAAMPVMSFDFHARFLRLALRAGESRHLCRALCLELLYQARTAPIDRRRIRHVLQKLEELGPLVADDAVSTGTTSGVIAIYTALMGEFAAARPHFERALVQLQRCAEAQWEMYATWAAGVASYSMTGELAEMHRRMELPLLEARERNNLYGLTTLVLGPGTLRWLALDEPRLGREEADEVIARWSRAGPSIQHYGHVVSLAQVELYEGRSDLALERLGEKWAWLERAGLLVPPGTMCRMLDLRARALLLEAVRKKGGQGGEPLLRRALGDARRLGRLGVASARGIAELVRAGVVAVRGEPQAVAAYAQAAEALERAGLGLHAAAARIRQGELMGGEAGWARVADAEMWMKQQGIVNTGRMVAMYAPMPRRAPTKRLAKGV